MRKKIIISFALIGILAIGGCSRLDETNEINPVETNKPINDEAKLKIISISENPKDISDFEIVGEEYYCDIDGDEEEEKIALHTSAQKEDGYFMWDDSHDWILRVEDGDNIYELYNEHIHGKIYMSVYDYYNDGNANKVISLNISESASNEIREYTNSDGNFYENIVYTTNTKANEGISELYSTIPDYE